MLEPCDEEIFGEIQGCSWLAKVEVQWCREHMYLRLAVLSSDEGLEGPPVFRVCVQGPSRHDDSIEKVQIYNISIT